MKSTGNATKARNLRTGVPVWLAEERPPSPEHQLTHDLVVDVAVIGGGVSGALVADAMVQAGQTVAVFDRRGLVKGSTPDRQKFEPVLRDKDAQLQEIQHRVKNNLQMITALVRIEARNARGQIDTVPFDRLAGRINALQILYSLLSSFGKRTKLTLAYT